MLCLYRDGKGLDCLADAVRCAAACSGDKAVDVRDASTSLMTTLIEVGTCQRNSQARTSNCACTCLLG